jgi:hypothetical protein
MLRADIQCVCKFTLHPKQAAFRSSWQPVRLISCMGMLVTCTIASEPEKTAAWEKNYILFRKCLGKNKPASMSCRWVALDKLVRSHGFAGA